MSLIRKLTSAEMHNLYVPTKAWVLVEKDEAVKKTAGGIIIPDNQVSQHSVGTGVIVQVSKVYGASSFERYLQTLYREGDRVAYSYYTPYVNPIPPFWIIENEDKSSDKTVTLSISDLFGIICDSEKERRILDDRIMAVNAAHQELD
jgi:co-chaperonin GroES (HSP10)